MMTPDEGGAAMMTPDEGAEAIRAAGKAVPLMQGSLANVKELRERCLEHGVPAMIYRPPREGGG
jgi:hypothetical protein